MASKSVKALKNLSKYEIDCCICNYVVVTYLKMGYFGCTVDFSSDGIKLFCFTASSYASKVTCM